MFMSKKDLERSRPICGSDIRIWSGVILVSESTYLHLILMISEFDLALCWCQKKDLRMFDPDIVGSV